VASDERVPVAVVGAGRMGSAMVRRLRHGGHPVTVFDRTHTRAADLAAATGAVATSTAREAAANADVVVVSVADDAAVKTVHHGTDGLVAGLRLGAVVVETSTVAPHTVREVVPAVEQRSAKLLDAPVSGSVAAVERGELTFLVGGDAGALDRVRPVVEVLASRIFHLGEVGMGSAMKLSVNTVLAALNEGLAEALVLAEKAGLDRAAAYEVFAASAIGAPFVHDKRAAFLNPDDRTVEFSIALLAKDLALADGLAATVHARTDQLSTDQRILGEAIQAGLADRDISAVAVLLRRDS
jgi:3-hydroxyisobutyrate dehydrogenase-like beta-hydroxyacid dehydrogenase